MEKEPTENGSQERDLVKKVTQHVDFAEEIRWIKPIVPDYSITTLRVLNAVSKLCKFVSWKGLLHQ